MVFQPSFFRGELLNFGGVAIGSTSYDWGSYIPLALNRSLPLASFCHGMAIWQTSPSLLRFPTFSTKVQLPRRTCQLSRCGDCVLLVVLCCESTWVMDFTCFTISINYQFIDYITFPRHQLAPPQKCDFTMIERSASNHLRTKNAFKTSRAYHRI